MRGNTFDKNRPHKVVNVGTESPVSHTESGEVMLWPDAKSAAKHAYNLTMEYKFTRPELNPSFRSWVAILATAEEIAAAKSVGAFGVDYEDIIGTGQARPTAKGVRDPTKGEGDEIRRFGEALDRSGFKRVRR